MVVPLIVSGMARKVVLNIYVLNKLSSWHGSNLLFTNSIVRFPNPLAPGSDIQIHISWGTRLQFHWFDQQLINAFWALRIQNGFQDVFCLAEVGQEEAECNGDLRVSYTNRQFVLNISLVFTSIINFRSLTPTGNLYRNHCHLMEWTKDFEVPCASFGLLLKIYIVF